MTLKELKWLNDEADRRLEELAGRVNGLNINRVDIQADQMKIFYSYSPKISPTALMFGSILVLLPVTREELTESLVESLKKGDEDKGK